MNDFLTHLSDSLHPRVWNIIVIVFSIVVGLLIRSILVPLVKSYSTPGLNYSIIRSSVKHLSIVFAFFIPLLILNALLPLMEIGPIVRSIMRKCLEGALTICFAVVIIKIIRITEDYFLNRFDYNKSDNLKERKIRTQLQFMRKVLITIIIIVTIAIVLLSFESMRKVGTGLLTGVGIGGIIIGFAAQKSLGNILAGFQIAFTQPIRIDDVLVIEGEWGRVEEITMTYVVVNIWDKRRLILPIQYFIEKPFQNWTRTTAEILGTVFIYTDFTVEVNALREKLTSLLQGNSLWDGKVNVLQVTDSKAEVMEIRCLMSCRNSGEAFDLRCYVREHMIKFMQEEFPESLSKTRVSIDSPSSNSVSAP